MKISNLSTCIISEKIEETKDIYVDNFEAEIVFDCGWYIDVIMGNSTHKLQFISPQHNKEKRFKGDGITINIGVEDVDKEYSAFKRAKLNIVSKIKDNPWGDRSFVVLDPNGVRLYIYSEIEMSEEFLEAVKK